MKNGMLRSCLFVILAGAIALQRLLPHPPNFAAAAGVALFAGFFFRKWWVAVTLPVVGMVVSDWVIGFYDSRILAVVYASLCAPTVFRGLLRSQLTGGRIFVSSVLGSLLFFAGTNLAVWMWTPLYTGDLAGLIECYISALPFLGNTIVGDLCFSSTAFLLYGLWQCGISIEPLLDFWKRTERCRSTRCGSLVSRAL